MSSNFYFPPSRLAFIEGLQADCSRTGVLAIEGPMGIGKTTVMEELLTSVMPNANKCYVTATESLNDIQIRSRIVEQLFGNVLYDPEKPLLSTFLEFHKSVPIMMALDNGHYLSGQIVGELLQVVAELKKQGLHIVLVINFDKSISNTLGSISSALIIVKPLAGLTDQESYSLLANSFDDVPSPTNPKVKRWIDDSKGNPTQLLAYDNSGNLKLTQSENFNLRLWGSVMVTVSLIIALSVYGYRQLIVKSEGANVSERSAIKEKDELLAKAPVVSDWSKAKVQNLAEQKKIKEVTAGATNQGDANPTKTPAKIEDTSNNQPTGQPTNAQLKIPSDPIPVTANNQEIFSVLQVSTNNNVEDVSDKVKEASSQEQIGQEEQLKHAGLLKQEGQSKQEGTVGSPAKPLTNAALTSEAETEADLVSKQKSTQTSKSVPDETQVLEPVIAPYLIAGYSLKTQEMLTLPANKYVLQLTAVTQEKTLENYLNSKSLTHDKTRIYRIERNGQTWLILTYGLFDTIADARSVAQNIDPKSWAKSVAVIQQQIKKYNESLSQ